MDSSVALGRLEHARPVMTRGSCLPEGAQSAHLNGCVPLSHQVAGHKYGVDKVGQYMILLFKIVCGASCQYSYPNTLKFYLQKRLFNKLPFLPTKQDARVSCHNGTFRMIFRKRNIQ